MPRKKPFSGRQKKEQLKLKKQKHGQPQQSRCHAEEDSEEDSAQFVSGSKAVSNEPKSFFETRPATGRGQQGKYALMFRPESKEEIERLKNEARKGIVPVQEEYLECQIEDFYTPELDFPTRPPWNFKFSVEQLENNERKYFNEYLKRIDERFEKTDLSYFELNLETWRQFWRVLEMSDILLCIVDVRYPPLLFPPKLYEYAGKELGKHIILIMNKIDLAPAPLVLAWKEYFKSKYPQLDILCFTSCPSYNLHGNVNEASMKGQKRRGKLRMASEGALEVYKTCERIVSGQVDLTKWKDKIVDEMNSSDVEDAGEGPVDVGNVDTSKPDLGYFEFKKFQGGILTIGCLGQPNVGKSSLINALMGKKVVSVSKTPGHTKHFQTIFLTPNVRLCDCPGLIFPSRVPKSLQVLCGSYPIAQLREPYSTVKYLAERLDLPRILRITHPEGDTEWSAFDIADAWALKRGYYTAKASRPDSYRAANHILRLALDGRICLCLRPPNYLPDKAKWEADPRIAEIEHIQAKSRSSGEEKHYSAAVVESDLSDEDEVADGEAEKQASTNEEFGGKAASEKGEEEEDDDEEEVVKPSNKTGSSSGKVNMQNKFALLLDNDDDEDDDDD